MIRTISILTLFALYATTSLACSCVRKGLKQNYCAARTAVIGRVVATFDNCPGRKCDTFGDQRRGKIFYVVRVLRKFKGPAIEDDLMYVSTSVNSALCGMRLRLNLRYFFVLPKIDKSNKRCPTDYFPFGLCSGVLLWSKVPNDDQLFFQRNSKLGVGCTVVDEKRTGKAGNKN